MKKLLINSLVIVSIISILISTYLYFNNEKYVYFISLLSNIIQIVLFFLWIFEKPIIPIKTIEQVEKVYNYADKEKKENEKRIKIMGQLMKAGLIPSEDIKKAFRKLKLKEVICMQTYGEGISSNLLKEYGLTRQPLITLLEKLGFIRIFGHQTLYIIFKDDLPVNMRKLANLESFLDFELNKEWNKISNFTKERYPSNKYKIYEKWRDESGFKCSYILLKSIEEELIINYKNKYSFTPDFISKILSEYQKTDKSINSYQIKNFLLNLKINLLLDGEDQEIIKEITKHEIEIKKRLNIKNFFEFRNKSEEEIESAISEFINKPLANKKEISSKIKNNSEEYFKIFNEMDLL